MIDTHTVTTTPPTQQNPTISYYYCTHDGKRGSCLTTRRHKGATIWANPIRDLRGPPSSWALKTLLPQLWYPSAFSLLTHSTPYFPSKINNRIPVIIVLIIALCQWGVGKYLHADLEVSRTTKPQIISSLQDRPCQVPGRLNIRAAIIFWPWIQLVSNHLRFWILLQNSQYWSFP